MTLAPYERQRAREAVGEVFDIWMAFVGQSALTLHEQKLANEVLHVFIQDDEHLDGAVAGPLHACMVQRLQQPLTNRQAVRSLTLLSMMNSSSMWPNAFSGMCADLRVERLAEQNRAGR